MMLQKSVYSLQAIAYLINWEVYTPYAGTGILQQKWGKF